MELAIANVGNGSSDLYGVSGLTGPHQKDDCLHIGAARITARYFAHGDEVLLFERENASDAILQSCPFMAVLLLLLELARGPT
ncbi:hypothetical protein [Enterovirga sp. CN4-39]|uniref:hypothetical protein n=1 Tax=Enterovirga sp. CN4-39 TaxID=3400910 RepID=UPI003C0A7C9A